MTQQPLWAGIFNASLSEFAQQQVSALSASTAKAKERALGFGVAAAEGAAQRLEGVAQKLREKGQRSSEQLGAEMAMSSSEQQALFEAVAEAELLDSQATQALGSATCSLDTSTTLPVGALDTSATLPVEPVWRPSSGISLASTVLVERVPSPTWHAPAPPAPLTLEREAAGEKSAGRSEEEESLQLGLMVEVYCLEAQQWLVGRVGATHGETVTVYTFNATGAFSQRSFATGDSCLASFGTHVTGPPPGFQAVPSVSRPGQLTYVNIATEVKYRCAEHAWQEYFNGLLPVVHEGTAKVLRPRESHQEEAQAHFNATSWHRDVPIAEPVSCLETINFNASLAAATASAMAPLPPIRPARTSAPAVVQADSHIYPVPAQLLSTYHSASVQAPPGYSPPVHCRTVHHVAATLVPAVNYSVVQAKVLQPVPGDGRFVQLQPVYVSR